MAYGKSSYVFVLPLEQMSTVFQIIFIFVYTLHFSCIYVYISSLYVLKNFSHSMVN